MDFQPTATTFFVQFSGSTATYGRGMLNAYALHDVTDVAPVPEPTNLVVWSLLGGIGLVVGHRRRRGEAV